MGKINEYDINLLKIFFVNIYIIKTEVQIRFVWKHELQFKKMVCLETWMTILYENCLET